MSAQELKALIRTVPDWPKPGVQFRDITSLLEDPKAYRKLIDFFIHHYFEEQIDAIVGIDARGFIIGGALAYELRTAFIPVRKKGKLPGKTISSSYSLEYGQDEVEIHAGVLKKGDRVIIVDDLIATGGTMLAAAHLVTELGATIIEACAVVDLPDLGGSSRLSDAGHKVFSLCSFEGD